MLAYNLVRLEMDRIAKAAEVEPTRISFVESLRLSSTSGRAGVCYESSMRRSSRLPFRIATAAIAVIGGVVFGPGCYGMAQFKADSAAAHQQRMAKETDPDTRAYFQDWNDCVDLAGFDSASMATSQACHFEREVKRVASLKAQAAAAKVPAVKEVFLRAAACIEKAPRMFRGPRSGSSLVPTTECLNEKTKTMATAGQAEEDEYLAAEKVGTVDAWLAFIAKHRDHTRVPDAAKNVVAAGGRAEGDAQVAIDEKLVSAYPAGIAELPVGRRILVVGPKGLRVRDLVKLSNAKVSAGIVVSRVKASAEPYKSFDGDELAALKQLGIPDEVVMAMIDVTTKLEDRKKADEERQAMRAEIAALKAMIEGKKAGAGGAKSGQTVQTKDGPLDVLESCAKRLGAMTLCEKIPFPGSTICSATAESSFPCPAH